MRNYFATLVVIELLMFSSSAQVVTVTAPDAVAAETGVDPGLYRVSRTGDTGQALDVSLSYGGSGVAGRDYDPLPARVTIPAGQAEVDVPLNPINDAEVEAADDTVQATVEPGAGYSAGSPGSATVTITNNDEFDKVGPLLHQAVAASANSITIRWTDNFQTEAKFRVRRSKSSSMSSPTSYEVPANTTSYTFTGLTAGTLYYFDVGAERLAEPVSSALSNRVSATAATPAPTPAFTNFEEWRGQAGLDAAARAESGGSSHDPDRDGIPNLLEYALGRDPLRTDAEAPLAVSDGGGGLLLEWDDVTDLLDVTVALAESDDLQSWSVSPLATTAASGVRSALDSRTATKRFYRLAASPMTNRTPTSTITCWGDSLTAGTSSQPWPGQLASTLGGRTVHNGGIGGETSSQILDRIFGLSLTSPPPAASTPAGTVLRLVASRVVPPRSVDVAYRSNWPAYCAAIANARKVEFLNFGRKIGEAASPLTAEATTNRSVSPTRFLCAGHPFADGDIVHFSTGSLPAPLVVGKPYFVRDADPAGLSLSETVGGSPVEMASDLPSPAMLTGPFVFEWTHPGGASALSLRTHTDHDTHTVVFWMGRNNLGKSDRVLADLRAAIAHIKAMDARFLVLSVLTADTEPVGSTNYMYAQNLNARLRAEFPNEFVDVRSALLRGGSGTGQDAIDRAADITPASLRTDLLHLNNTGNQIVAATIATALQERGW